MGRPNGRKRLQESILAILEARPENKNCILRREDKTRSVEWEYEVGIEGASAHIEWGWFYGIILADTDKIWESDDFKSFEKIEDESYSVGETKWPVFNALLKNGWKIKPRVLPQQVRKKRA